MNKYDNESKSNRYFYFAVVICILGLICPPVVMKLQNTTNMDILGPTGDWLGGSSVPLLNFASFIMLLAAFIQQKQELTLTRSALEDQRQEMELTREEFNKQNQTLNIQRFESTFFNMLSLHNQITESITLVDIDEENPTQFRATTGRSCFYELSDDFLSKINQSEEAKEFWNVLLETPDISDESLPILNKEEVEELVSIIKFYCSDYYKMCRNITDHYFKNLNAIARLLNNSTAVDKSLYANIFISQLTYFELQLLFLYIIIDPSNHGDMLELFDKNTVDTVLFNQFEYNNYYLFQDIIRYICMTQQINILYTKPDYGNFINRVGGSD